MICPSKKPLYCSMFFSKNIPIQPDFKVKKLWTPPYHPSPGSPPWLPYSVSYTNTLARNNWEGTQLFS
jgi:hypothetical protein